MFSPLSFGIFVIPLLIITFAFLKHQILNARSPLRRLPGPPSRSWLYGNLAYISQRGQSFAWDEWMATYGKTFHYPSVLNSPLLFTTDPLAVNHILTHSDAFEKSQEFKAAVTLLGEGLVLAEGQKHRKQRRIMNPAFGPGQLKSFTPIFNQKATQLRNIWLSQLDENRDGVIRVNFLSFVNRATLDIIGLAGFGYEFDSLHSKKDELSAVLAALASDRGTSSFRWIFGPLLVPLLPLLLNLPWPAGGPKRFRDAKKIIDRIGDQLVAERKSALFQKQSHGTKETSEASGKDLLTLLVQANLQDSDAMSDSDVRAQIGTFLVAGHETTSTAMSWTLFGLCQNLEAQRKLREELLTVQTDDPTVDELKSLPYLDMVVRESLRLYAPLFVTKRLAVKDAVLPMKDGSSISVREGDAVVIPIYAMNTDRDIWGDDALKFKPERWGSLPEAVSENPGVWSNLMTFLGGSRACIGYQFAIVEMKCLLFALIRKFEFGLALPAEDIVWWNQTLVRRPFVKGAEREGPKLPLYVKLHVSEA